jgi:tetratricopeptide (TPR) repeat protein/tRNA A-37 threonylcarbamoyl transferase component Bud32
MGRFAMSDAPEEQLPLWLAACDEALAAGTEGAALPEPDVPGELRPRLERELEWCRFVRQLWPQVNAGDLPSTLPEGPEAAGEPTAELPLARLGRFELRRELGRGAFGVVFLAHDPRLGRDVALKVPRAEALLTPELRARFQQEARAAAALDHPNLVPVYDAGAEGAVCYIASAYCSGTTLAAWLRERTEPVPVRQAARLMAVLARAVEHAHQRGVLHRDLKPGNIMLEAPAAGAPAGRAPDDLGLVPRVTDFGLAKLSAAATEATGPDCHTHTGAILGTARYMAPEQAEGQSKAVGPAADVYSLGAIFYELLTGRAPLVGETQLATLQLVRTQEPLSPGRLRPGLPRDLETICLHCLHKEPGKRYPSARALAEDLDRFLAGEPIRARPVAAWERALKWARRHPAPAALVGVSGTAVLAVAVLVGGFNARLIEQRNLAETRRREAEAQSAEASAQRRRALTHLRNAVAAVDRMLAAADRLAPAPYTLTVRRQLTEDGLRLFQDLAREEDRDPEIRYEVGRAWRRVGQLQGGLGQREQAEQSYRKAALEFEQLTALEPGKPAYERELAAGWNNLALALGPNELAESERLLRRALAMQDRLAADHPDAPGYRLDAGVTRGDLATVLFERQRPEEADQATREAVDGLERLVAAAPSERDQRFALARVLNNHAAFLGRRGRTREAEPVLRRAALVFEPLAEGPGADPASRSQLALTLHNLGILLAENGRPEDGLKAWRRAADLKRRLVSDFPEVPAYRAGLGETLSKLALLLRDRGDLDEAGRLWEDAIRNQRDALVGGINDPGTVQSFGINLFNLAELCLQQKRYREAAQVAEALRTLRRSTGHGDYEAARVLSRCIPLAGKDAGLPAAQRQELAADYSRRAVAYLRLAVQKGRKDAATWGSDEAFAPLRSRPDFQQLLSDAARKP